MKKAIVILLLAVYSTSTIGATINMHYCMNKLASWSFSAEKKDKCSKCGMSNTGCCKDEKKKIKLSLDQQKTTYSQYKHCHVLFANTAPGNFTKASIVAITTQNLAYLHAPPIQHHQDAQAKLSIFLI